ncbi:MAG: Gfo/Idh/MocA family oxidoreductase [Clostridium sp.]|nr:Gfo/Idh/MocA family oxidoreductase [Clostridium sp.]
MRVAVIGLGSMGKRRIRLLKQYIEKEGKRNGRKNEKWEITGIDLSRERCLEVEELCNIETFSDLDKGLSKGNIDCALICSSPASHAELIHECLKRGLHVFTEMNLVNDRYHENQRLAGEKKRVLFLSSTFLYRKEIEFIKEKLQEKSFGGGYFYHIGQYLPDWHPWEKYQNFFIGEKRTNACREIFAIEMPWLIDTFGGIKQIQGIHKKISSLEIDYDDMYHLTLEHESGVVGSLIVDVVSPKAERIMNIWEEHFHLEWRGTPDSLRLYEENTGNMISVALYENVERAEGYSAFVVENAYYEELAAFFAAIRGEKAARYSFGQDEKVLAWIDRIEELK